jgi:hypothetical protein
MLEWVREVVVRHKTHGIVADSNVLVLLLVGSFSRERVGELRNTEMFAPEDYDVLVWLLGQFDKMIATPHILAEVSNLVSQIREPVRSLCLCRFTQIIEQLVEEGVPSVAAAHEPAFKRLGLTDAGITHLVKDKYPVVTTDFALWEHLARNGVDAINFNHLRQMNWTA